MGYVRAAVATEKRASPDEVVEAREAREAREGEEDEEEEEEEDKKEEEEDAESLTSSSAERCFFMQFSPMSSSLCRGDLRVQSTAASRSRLCRAYPFAVGWIRESRRGSTMRSTSTQTSSHAGCTMQSGHDSGDCEERGRGSSSKMSGEELDAKEALAEDMEKEEDDVRLVVEKKAEESAASGDKEEEDEDKRPAGRRNEERMLA